MKRSAGQNEPRTRTGGQRGSAVDGLTLRASARLAGVLITLFALLTFGAATGWAALESLDSTVGRWAYDHTYGHQLLRQSWLIVTTVGQPWGLRLVLLAVAAFQAQRQRWTIAGWLLATVVVELIVAPSAKYLLSRPRPYWNSPITLDGGLGFPSGHAAAASMLATTVTLLVLMTGSRRSLRWLCIGAVVVIVVLVPASRLFLGVHYLTDVLAGLLLGAALSLIVWCVFARYMSRTFTELREG